MACLYFGNPDECPECGFYNHTGQRFCSHECAGSFDERQRRNEAVVAERRAEEQAFADAVDRLRGQGLSYEDCDRILGVGSVA